MTKTSDKSQQSEPTAESKNRFFTKRTRHDIAVNTISGLLVLFLGYLGALALGYIATPSGNLLIVTIFLIGCMLVPFIATYIFVKKANLFGRTSNRTQNLLLCVPLALFFAFGIYTAVNIFPMLPDAISIIFHPLTVKP